MRCHIHLILDRSGSMKPAREATLAAVQEFIDGQARQPGDASLAIVQFDSGDPYEVILQVPHLAGSVSPSWHHKYQPRSATPLYDAIGRGIADCEERAKRARADAAIFVIQTDGHENSSSTFTMDRLNKLISDKQESGWQFVFLGADHDAIAEAGKLGIGRANTMAYDKGSTEQAVSAVSHNVSAYRTTGLSTCMSFTDDQRQNAMASDSD